MCFFRGIVYSMVLFCLLCGVACKRNERQFLADKDRIFKAIDGVHFEAADSLRFNHIVDSIYQSIPRRGDYQDWERYRAHMGFRHGVMFDHHGALAYADSMLLIYGPESDQPWEQELYAYGMYKQGDVFLALGRYDEAYASYYEASRMNYTEKDSCSFWEYNSKLGGVNFELKRYREAIGYYKQWLQSAERCFTSKKWYQFAGTQGTLDNIGIAYVRMGQLDSAEYYFQEALSYINEHKMEYAEGGESWILMAQAVIYGNLAEVRIKQGNYEEAEDLLLKSIAINLHPNRATIDAGFSLLKLAELYLVEDKVAKAEPLLTRADSIRQKNTNTDLTLRYLRAKGHFLLRKGQPNQAFELLEREMNMRDSLSASLESEEVPDMRQAFEHIDRQHQTQLTNRRKSEFLQIAVFFGLMLLVILLLLWRNYRRSQKHIAELNRLNEDIRQKNRHLLSTMETLEQIYHDKQRMMSVVAHDLRGPIGSIASLAQLYEGDLNNPKETKEIFDLIVGSAQSALTLIGEIMQTRMVEKTGSELIEMQALLRYCISLIQHRADEKKHHIRLTGNTVTIEGYREKLLRIFHNLLDNAIKFSPQNSSINIRIEQLPAHVQVSVSDNGIGMPEEMKKVAVDRQPLTVRAGTDGEPSFGLGLSIAYQLVEEHQGKIWFTSEDGKGTTFFLLFPLR
jgi:signal transduction histidine kinase